MTRPLSHDALLDFRDQLHLPEFSVAGSIAQIDVWLAQHDDAVAAGQLDPRPSWEIAEAELAERVAAIVLDRLAATNPTTAPVAAQAEREAVETVVPTTIPKSTATAAMVRAIDVGMSRREWRAAIRRGELRARKIGREYVATRADFDEYLAARQVAPTPRARRERPVDPAEAAVQKALASGALRAVGGGRK